MEDEDLSPTRALLDALEEHADPAAVAAALAAAPEPLTVRYRKVITDHEAEVLDRHADALALLEALYMACWVVGTLFDEEQRPAAEAADDSRVYVLRQLWARSLQTGGEVLALLRFGYPDGALARWRQLHEVEVIARLLADGSPELADAYVEHTRLQSVRWRHDYQRWAKAVGEELFSGREMTQMGETARRVLAERPEWKGNYGWAHRELLRSQPWYADEHGARPRHGGPTFADLERAVGMREDRLWTAVANQSVHLTLPAADEGLGGVPEPDAVFLAGQLTAATLWLPTAALVVSWPAPGSPDRDLQRRVDLLAHLAALSAERWRSPAEAGDDGS